MSMKHLSYVGSLYLSQPQAGRITYQFSLQIGTKMYLKVLMVVLLCTVVFNIAEGQPAGAFGGGVGGIVNGHDGGNDGHARWRFINNAGERFKRVPTLKVSRKKIN